MDKLKYDLHLNESWTCSGVLKNIVSISEVESSPVTVSIDDFTSVDSSVCLQANTCDQNPEVTLTVSANVLKLDIASEAAVIEVFGHQGEYLFTCLSELHDDWEDFLVYHSKINLKVPMTTITLKFGRLKEKNRLWIYGLHIQTSKSHILTNPEVVPAWQQFAAKFSNLNLKSQEENGCTHCIGIEERLNKKIETVEKNILAEIGKQNSLLNQILSKLNTQ